MTSLVLFFFIAGGVPISSLVSPARAAGEEDLAEAQRVFEMLADYEGSLAIVDRLLEEKELKADALRDAHVLRARCLLALDRDAEAQDAFCNALGVDRSWRPDEFEYTHREIEIFNAALVSCAEPEPAKEEKKGGLPWKILAAAGVALVAGVVLLTGGGEEEPPPPPDEELPPFPDPPTE